MGRSLLHSSGECVGCLHGGMNACKWGACAAPTCGSCGSHSGTHKWPQRGSRHSRGLGPARSPGRSCVYRRPRVPALLLTWSLHKQTSGPVGIEQDSARQVSWLWPPPSELALGRVRPQRALLGEFLCNPEVHWPLSTTFLAHALGQRLILPLRGL